MFQLTYGRLEVSHKTEQNGKTHLEKNTASATNPNVQLSVKEESLSMNQKIIAGNGVFPVMANKSI